MSFAWKKNNHALKSDIPQNKSLACNIWYGVVCHMRVSEIEGLEKRAGAMGPGHLSQRLWK